MPDPTLDGSPVFGVACHVVHRPSQAATQEDAYFGSNGVTSTFGGTRGRTFEIQGVLLGVDLFTVLSLEALLLTYCDGIARTFTDTQGRSYPNILFNNDYEPSPEGPRPAGDQGWCLPYRCSLRGLS